MVTQKKYQFSWRGKYIYALAFLIPFVVFVIYAVVGKIVPFGTLSFIHGDAFTQIYAFLCEMYRKVHEGESLLFSWNAGLGTNFYVNWCYYLASPSTWLLMLLPESMLELGCTWMIFGKLCLCAVTMTFYFMHTKLMQGYQYQRQLSLLFGVCYGLSAALFSYHILSNFLDAYLLLPLVLLSLERMMEGRGWRLYYGLLILVMASNFYMAFIVCLFLIVWFFCQADVRRMKGQLLRFAGVSLLSAATCAAVFLPVVMALSKKQPDGWNLDALYGTGNVWDLINAMLPFAEMDQGGTSIDCYHVYCGSLLVVAVVYYVLFSKDDIISRVKFTLALCFMGASLCVHALAYIWQGASFPHNFNNRFAFAFVFLILYIGCKGLMQLLDGSLLKLGVTVLAMAGLFVGVLAFADYLSYPITYLVIMFVWVLLFWLLWLLYRGSITKNVFVYAVLIGCIFEVAISDINIMSGIYSESDIQTKMYTEIDSFYADIQTSSGRSACYYFDFVNVGMLFHKSNASIYSSLTCDDVVTLYKKLGLTYMPTWTSYVYRGATAVTNLLMNTSVAVTKTEALYTGEVYDTAGDYMLMALDGSIGYGFLTEEDILNVSLVSENPFVNQNQLMISMGCPAEIFYDIKEIDEQTLSDAAIDEEFTYSFQVEKAADLYIYLCSEQKMGISVSLDDDIKTNTGSYVEMIHIGPVSKGQTITMSGYINDTLHAYMASYDEAQFHTFQKELETQSFKLEQMSGNKMKGTVTAGKDGVLYMSVPDDGGFTVYVDGKRTEHTLLENCMICVPLTQGEHEIKLIYNPPGFKPGIIISAISIIIFLIAGGKRKKKR